MTSIPTELAEHRLGLLNPYAPPIRHLKTQSFSKAISNYGFTSHGPNPSGHPTTSPISNLGLKRNNGQESQWQMAYVCRLHQPKQGMSKRQLPSTSHRLESGILS